MKQESRVTLLRLASRATANFAQLRSLSSRHPSKANGLEPLKYALDKRHSSIIIDCLLHLSPLAITGSLAYLNISHVYWEDIQAESKWQNTFLDLLQFTAKIHELWIGFSIAAILSHFTVLMLSKKRGLPFGLLGADLQVGNPGFYFQKSFWSSLSHGFHRPRPDIIIFSLFLLLCSILTAFSGPSSAIAMRPNLDWWQVPNDTLDFDYRTTFDLWPITLDYAQPTNSSLQCPDIYNGTYDSSFCPASGLSIISQSLLTIGPILPGNPLNTSFYDISSNTQRLLTSSILSGDIVHSYTSTLSLLPQMIIGGFWQDIELGKFSQPAITQPKLISHPATTLKEPLVQVRCNIYEYRDISSNQSTADDQMFFPLIPSITRNEHFTDSDLSGYPVPKSTWNGQDSRRFNLNWVDLYQYNGSASVGAVLMLPNSIRQNNGTGNNLIQDSLIAPCTFDARWIPSQVSFDPTTSDVVIGNLTSLGAFSDLGELISRANESSPPGNKIGSSEIINIDPRWAMHLNYLNIAGVDHVKSFLASSVNKRSTSSNVTIIEEILDQFLVPTPNNTVSFNYLNHAEKAPIHSADVRGTQTFVSVFMGMVMTNGLSHYGMPNIMLKNGLLFGPETSLYKSSESSSPTETMTRSQEGWHKWRFVVWRHGYSYGIQDTTTKLALCVLLTHAALTLCFIVYLCFSGWTTSSWGSIGELVALALNSRNTEQFRGADAGISSSVTWTQNIRIREVGLRGLEMRLGEDSDDVEKGNTVGKVKPGKQYGFVSAP